MSPPKNFTLEVCVETAGGLEACKGIVDRIELCTGLEVGGLTPSAGLMIAARESGLETHVLIRPRTGDFELSSQDLAVALNDIRAVKDAGLHGVVIGATKGAILDLGVLKELIAAADGLCITLHRAFDTVTDLPLALEQAIDVGFQRILTSGGAAKASYGIEMLSKLHKQAAGRIEIMVGSGVTKANVQKTARQTGIRSFHASCSRSGVTDASLKDFNFGSSNRETDRAEIIALAQALSQS